MSLAPAESTPPVALPDPPPLRPDAAGGHSHGDISALLFEIARAIRARRCLPADDVRCREAIARAHGACCGSVARHGSLTLIVEDSGFRVAATGERVGRDPAPALAMRCREQSVASLAFEPDSALDAFVRVIDALATGPGESNVDHRTPAQPGEQTSQADAAENDVPAQSAPASATANPETETLLDRDRTLDTLPCQLPHAEHRSTAAGTSTSDVTTEATAPTLRSPAESEVGTTSGEPQTRHAEPDDLCVEDDGFAVLERLLVQSADPSALEEARATARSELLARAAAAPLDVLVSRACARDAPTSIRASQILLQLGARVVPDLLDRIVAEKDEDRRGALCGVLIVMGETATPVLAEAMDGRDAARARTAIWLAGEIQNAVAVPALARAVESPDGQLRREALAKLGHPSAIAALDVLLASGDPERVSLAAWCLAASPGAAALSLLCERLRSATTHANFALAREIVHALARRGSTDVVPDLAVLFARRSLLHRRPLRELKLAAVRALSKIPGQSAERSLREAAEGRDPQVREAALGALARRSPGYPAAA
jgi:HEAT repeat protein